MAKRFKFASETCAYCATQPATTADHVFSREFFLVKRRANLPQVPACNSCNNAKSRLEHYLTAALPFGGRHTDSTENLTNLVPGVSKRTKRFTAAWLLAMRVRALLLARRRRCRSTRRN
jgi:5-methylcytosine-specific restriction endonuclease McrA